MRLTLVTCLRRAMPLERSPIAYNLLIRTNQTGIEELETEFHDSI